MKPTFILSLFSLSASCIPVRIAPNIKDDKIMVAKKFKRKLPKKHSSIFKDPKDANEFYKYVNTKYQLNHFEVDYNVPVEIDQKKYFLSFHETEISTKIINLFPMFVDLAIAAADTDGNSESYFDNYYYSRIGNWYLVLTLADEKLKDCLSPEYEQRDAVIVFLKKLKSEYLETSDYTDVLFKK